MHSSFYLRALLAAFSVSFGAWQLRADDAPTAAQLEFFETKVRPVLANRCYKCHSTESEELKGNLFVDSRQGLLDGGDSGAAIVPEDPESSYLLEAVSYENVDVQMPPKGKLPQHEIDALRQWIADGAVWPSEQPKVAANKKVFDLAERKASHWCWQPVKPQTAPNVVKADWVRDPIDAFVLARLEAANLTPAPAADRSTWLRRLSFALRGLPPSPEEVTAFVQNPAPDAYEKVVDRLLAVPQFGERWGRHWLDLVRYAETFGHEFDFPIFEAWRYRDYVIRAFNADVPYDQLVTEHIAGDLMPQPRLHPTDGTNESILGTGFWFLGEQTHAPVDSLQHQADRMDNQIDVMGKSFLGLTLGCARCHDHKFDAIATKDVYSLWGFVQSSRMQHAALDPHGKIAAATTVLKETRAAGDTLLSSQPGVENVPAPSAAPEATPASGDPIVFETFSGDTFANWFASGWAFGDGPTHWKQWDSFSRKPQLAAVGVAHSGMLSTRLVGGLRSKVFRISHNQIHVRVAGQKARVRVVIDGFMMDEHNALLFAGLIGQVDNDQFGWVTLAGDLGRYQGHLAYLELLDEGDGYVAVDEIVFSNHGPPARPAAPAPVSISIDAAVQAQLNELTAKLDATAKELPTPTFVLAMTDGEGIDQPVYVRGSHKNLGDVAPRGFLEAIAGANQPKFGSQSSGRMELAKHIADPQNPLTARVMVNRIWHHLFGRGIVSSTDNFGVLGQAPTHPELLDHLADRFVREGWSIKRLIRAIVLSNTYRMSSVANASARQADPQNLLLHHMPILRLEGEAVRDAILAVSGRLDSTLYGRSIPVHLTEFMQGRGRPSSGPLDGAGRRSIYIEVRRNFLSPTMLAFDAPIPFATIGTRSVSNVPAQALTLLNDPFVIEEARRWAKRMIAAEPFAAERRIEGMYALAFARQPRPEELAASVRFIGTQAAQYGISPETAIADERVWSDFAHVLLNCKEFVFIE